MNHRQTALLAAMTMLAACATTDFSSRSPELIVEGDEASYPAFEAAARACGYTAYWRFPGARAGTVSVGPHFNLFRTRSRAARCVIQWVVDHPEANLDMPAH